MIVEINRETMVKIKHDHINNHISQIVEEIMDIDKTMIVVEIIDKDKMIRDR